MAARVEGPTVQVADISAKQLDKNAQPPEGKHKHRSVQSNNSGNNTVKQTENTVKTERSNTVTGRQVSETTALKTKGLNQPLGDLPPLTGQTKAGSKSSHRGIPANKLKALEAEIKEANSLSQLGKTYEKLSGLRKEYLPEPPTDRQIMSFHKIRLSIRSQASKLVKKHFKDPAQPTQEELSKVSNQVSKFPDPRAKRALKITYNLPDTANKEPANQSVKKGITASEQLIATLDSALGESISSGDLVKSPTEQYSKSPTAFRQKSLSQPKKINTPHAANSARASQKSIDRLFTEARNTHSYTKLAKHIHQLSNNPAWAAQQNSVSQLTQRLVSEVLASPIDCQTLEFIYHKFISDQHPTDASAAVLNGILGNCLVILTQESEQAKSLVFNICRDIARASLEYHPQLEQLMAAASLYRHTSKAINNGILNIQMAVSFNWTDSALQEEQHAWVLAKHQIDNPSQTDALDDLDFDEEAEDDDLDLHIEKFEEFTASFDKEPITTEPEVLAPQESTQPEDRLNEKASSQEKQEPVQADTPLFTRAAPRFDNNGLQPSIANISPDDLAARLAARRKAIAGDSDSESDLDSTFGSTFSSTAHSSAQDSVTLIDIETEDESIEEEAALPVQTPPPAPKAPLPPKTPPPPIFSTPDDNGRQNLLKDIREGIKLKPLESNKQPEPSKKQQENGTHGNPLAKAIANSPLMQNKKPETKADGQTTEPDTTQPIIQEGKKGKPSGITDLMRELKSKFNDQQDRDI